LAGTVSTLAGVTHRIGELFEVLQEMDSPRNDPFQDDNNQNESSKILPENLGGISFLFCLN
jgi:hypothetical protein